MRSQSRTNKPVRQRYRLLSLALVVLFLGALAPLALSKPSQSLASGGLDGSQGTMQPLNLPARVSRIEHVPGKAGNEAWAIGHVERNGVDQVVFIHYNKGEGWRIWGLPRDEQGIIVNPVLSNFSIAPSGAEAWAVGLGGALVHFQNGIWTYRTVCGPGQLLPSDGCSDLMDVSIKDGYGFAVGTARRTASEARVSTILSYANGDWRLDSNTVIPEQASDFVAVTTVSNTEAWAVGGGSTRELHVYRRDSLTWTRQETRQEIFDNPAPSSDGRTVNLSAIGTSIAATPNGKVVWIGGGIYPLDPGNALGEPDMPFTLRWENGAFKSFCPPQYSVYNKELQSHRICDADMPVSPYDISSLSVLNDEPNTEVFASGMGLFHFKGGISGTWWREPNALSYLSSVSFVRSDEGWVTTSPNVVGGGRPALSSSTTIGHYTSAPQRAKVARWPQFNTELLYGVEVSPDGSTAFAVGKRGTGVIYRNGIGWDALGNVGLGALRAVAWSSPNSAWAVGDQGLIGRYNAGEFSSVDQGAISGGSHLYGVAFNSNAGVAVGDRGVILSFRGGNWNKDPSSGIVNHTLYDVAAVGRGFVAVGAGGTVLVNPSGVPGGWSVDTEATSAIGNSHTLFAADGLLDGTFVLGGSNATIWSRSPEGAMSEIEIDRRRGSILDVQTFRAGSGRLQIIASISLDGPKFQQGLPGTRRAYITHWDGEKWTDIDLSTRMSSYRKLDAGAYHDPAFALALEPSGTRGWAVGGTHFNVIDENENYNSMDTSSVYRIDLTGNAEPPNATILPKFDNPGFRFAFFSESSCGAGPCSISVGSGTSADEVALSIQHQIKLFSRISGGPRFLLFGGNMRSIGIPDELEQFRGYLSDFGDLPVLGALGPYDMHSPEAVSGLIGLVPRPPTQDLERAGIKPPDSKSSTATNSIFLTTFRNEWRPWGTGSSAKSHPNILPVDIGNGADPAAGARSHYAFDYAVDGNRLARFIVLDTSDNSYVKETAILTQNPKQDQAAWLPAVITDATTRNPPLPVIVTMNIPTLNPTTATRSPLLSDGQIFEAQAVASSVSAVLSGFVRANAVYFVPNAAAPKKVPIYVLGGGGAPLSGSKWPNDGNYHAFHVVKVDPSNVNLLNLQADVQVQTFPVIESVAMHAVDGLEVEGGNVLRFQGLARAIDGGGPPRDPDQVRRMYLRFPLPPRCVGFGSGGGGCLNSSALRPDYHFISEDITIADFVRPGPQGNTPLEVAGSLIKDDQAGFLCTFKAGRTHVKIVSGMFQMRMPVTVGAGFGPCVDKPVRAPEKPPPLPPAAPEIEPDPARVPLFHPPTFPDPLVLVLPPVPAPIAAPAPPASAAGARKEEEEAQYEEQSDQEDQSQFAVLQATRAQGSETVMTWLFVATSAMLGMVGAMASAAVAQRRRHSEIYVRWRS